MSFLKNVFKKKDTSISSYEDFWNWFQEHEKAFFKAVKNRSNIERDFFDQLSPKLNKLHEEELFFLAGMVDENTAELVITVDGAIHKMYVVEELVNAAPTISGWKFTALKEAMTISGFSIDMGGIKFNDENIFFYSNDSSNYPDEIDITLIHDDVNEAPKDAIDRGLYIYLDNFLGELEFATLIDNLSIVRKADAKKDLVPISKLKDFLNWRQKEFIEKYEGKRHNTENDNHSSFEGELNNGKPVIGIMNTALLQWDGKASHPWMMVIEIKYQGERNGLPDQITYDRMNEMEDTILKSLKDADGYLNIGRETGDGIREIYIACTDFRLPSKTLNEIIKNYSGKLNIRYDIYKDKYWKTLDRFQSN